ncbi:MAG: DUF1476 domain-containing protein [Phycisphaerales bacterium]|nr:DUF1476 domain-containing protein [Phycisphaerales bacterium]
MSGFDDRQKAMEDKFAHEQEMRFKVMAKRNHRLGLWAAGLMGMEGEDAEAFAKEVIRSDFEEAGDDDVLRMVESSLSTRGVEMSSEKIRAEMDRLLNEVMEELS